MIVEVQALDVETCISIGVVEHRQHRACIVNLGSVSKDTIYMSFLFSKDAPTHVTGPFLDNVYARQSRGMILDAFEQHQFHARLG